MPHVKLAYRYGDHQPGETVEVTEDEAIGLVRDGLAQRVDAADADAEAGETAGYTAEPEAGDEDEGTA